MEQKQEDLRMLYQVLSSQLEFSKNQQWNTTYYGILVLAGIAGYFKLLDEPNVVWVIAILAFLALLAAIIPTAFICKHEESLCKTRRKYEIISKHLSPTFQHLVRYPEGYSSARYDAHFWVTLIVSLWFGFFLVLWYLAKGAIPKGGTNMSSITIADWIVAIAALFQVGFSGLLLWYIRKQKGLMEVQNNISDKQIKINEKQSDISHLAVWLNGFTENLSKLSNLRQQRDSLRPPEDIDAKIRELDEKIQELREKNGKIKTAMKPIEARIKANLVQ